MTDRERLIGLLSEYDFDATFCNICERPFDDCAVCGSERLADYLIECGVIVLPCKVGDTVYVLTSDSITGFEKSGRLLKKEAEMLDVTVEKDILIYRSYTICKKCSKKIDKFIKSKRSRNSKRRCEDE